MEQKLAYDWKNIYRMLTIIDSEDSGLVSLIDFEKSCIKAGITLGQSELHRLYKNYGEYSEEQDLIDFKRLSYGLGMHKESYNHLNKAHQNTRIKNISKIRQLYSSIEAGNPHSPLKRNNNHKSTLGLRTITNDGDPFLNHGGKSMSPSKHTMSSKLKTQMKSNILQTEKRAYSRPFA